MERKKIFTEQQYKIGITIGPGRLHNESTQLPLYMNMIIMRNGWSSSSQSQSQSWFRFDSIHFFYVSAEV